MKSLSSAGRFATLFLANAPAFALGFVLQRLFTWKTLGLETLPTSNLQTQAMITGVLADVWGGVVVGLICSTIVLLLHGLFRAQFFVNLAVSVLIAHFLALHIIYVEFFGGMMSLAHFKYLLDPQFVGASFASLVETRVVLISLSVTILSSLLLNIFIRHQRGVQRAAILLFCAGLFSQIAKVNLNTKKIGWKTPPILAMTSIENVFVQFQDPSSVSVEPLTEEEMKFLTTLFLATKGVNHTLQGAQLKTILEKNSLPATSAVGLEIKNSVLSRIGQKKRLHIFVLVLESLRPEDSAFFTPQNSKTFTPFLDSIAETSVSFSNAYTSGAVTRAGQEATYCGLLVGEFTSAMRNIPSLNPKCFIRALKEKYANNVWGAWWHGGDFNFDGQGTFWKRQGFDHMVHRGSFRPGEVGTYWGISDFMLVETLKRTLKKEESPAPLQAHLFLSITNHPDWAYPGDTPKNISDLRTSVPHISQITALYTDEAVKNFVTFLKTTSCANCQGETYWDSSLIVITNDHGTLVPSERFPNGLAWLGEEKNDANAAGLLSRSSLIVTGGVVEQSLANKGLKFEKVTRPVSQVDIYATLSDLAGLVNQSTVGDSLFAETRRWPVIVDLGSRIFVPDLKENKVFSRTAFLSPLQHSDLNNTDLAKARLFFRAYQGLLLAGDAGR